VFLGDDDMSKAIMAALDLSPIGRPIAKYLTLFTPAKSKLTPAKFAALLGEISPMIAEQAMKRNGISHSVPLAIWESAIRKTLAARDAGKLTLPFKTHGYLLEVVVSELAHAQADKDARASAKKASESHAVEQQLADARRRADEKEKPKTHVPAPVPAAWANQLKEMLATAKQAPPLTPEQKAEQVKRLQSVTANLSAEEQAKLNAYRTERGDFALEA
jgi:hypothetical protein